MKSQNDLYVPTSKQAQRAVAVERQSGSTGAPLVGSIFLKHYEVFGARQGGFGVVYLVQDLRTGQKYAVKSYRTEFHEDPRSVVEFKKEVAFWIGLGAHPNVVQAHFVEEQGGRPYLFLEYVSSSKHITLRELLWSHNLRLDEAINFAYQLCLGMEFANGKEEIAHLDLKPENLLIDGSSVLKVTDFGLAQYVRAIQGSYLRASAGTWPYASPERFLGRVEDTRSDIFSFGIIFHELLTGTLPYALEREPLSCYEQFMQFHKRNGMGKILERGFPDLQESTSAILSFCLAPYQGARPESFSALRKELEQAFPEATYHSYHPSFERREEDLFKAAVSMSKIGELGRALDLFNELLQLEPNNASAWSEAGNLMSQLGRKEEADDCFKRASSLVSSD